MSKKLKLIPIAAAFLAFNVFAKVDTFTFADLPVLKQESQHSTASKRVTNFFTRAHYKLIQLDDELSSQILDRYIESIDYNRRVFLQSDIDSFEKYRTSVDNALSTGKLDFAFDIFNLSLKRRFERYQYSLALLENEMTFDKADDYLFDREDLPWPKTTDELNEIWRQKVKYDALRLKLTGKDWSEIKTVLEKRYSYTLKRLIQTNSEDAFQIAMNSFARSIEAHTSYLSPRRAEQFKMDMDLELEGIGAVLGYDEDYTVIRSLVPGGPADKSEKIKSNDRIIGVAQGDDKFVDVIGWRLDDVVELIKGPKGTTVRLQYLKGADAHGTPSIVEIIRDKIRLEDKAVKASVFTPKYTELDTKIGVIDIPGFYNNLSADVKKEIAKLKEEKVDGIIIDLRQNGGGSLYEATQLSGLFIDQGPVVQIHTLNGRVEEQKDVDGVTFYDGPLTVLVDRYSASASEIFAAAMQDYGRAVIIGEQTFGKGTVQQHRGLGRNYDLYDNELGSVQYTIAKFYRINGGSTQHKGVIPDISLPSPIDPAEWGESQEDNALPWDHIANAKYSSLADLAPAITFLQKKHDERIKTEPEFNYVFDDIERYKKEKNRKRISLIEKQRITERDDNDKIALQRTNERLKRLGQPEIAKLDDVPEIISELDPFLEETAQITSDYIKYGRYAKK
ncbi:carboxy terminal-processing peptidase [Pseudoalteromonas tunicata]|uniref:Periplasmic carboxy-terminal protease with specificity for non-polar C-termini n=1 Tax=Pseudoalteromonas tunicata D2 TaxID=87626 RepID=A4CC82_9GAMM|nr:carboxy terminal-processing peptidase [Pseudoalteromonas tunicata]ATC94518.1 carboxyl-terminal processing protease [Pseudoalteromonas tunicata]AXT30244.1 carboxy terminal-processing peptidase [Pseudoalteromonas tunicata]EAR27969.1 periplasmic carboxy-terminal protease with specificity for non-polar C-termini [Pseudoalteromonas tunicata D2]